jgi:DNA-binding HxlR family transcriptional regulator
MGMARQPKQQCDLGELFHLLGSPYVLDVLHVALVKGGPIRFKEFQVTLGISPNTLTGRLKELVDAGLLTREAFNEIPPRVEYTPSAKAQDLMPVFETLDAWSKKHNLKAAPLAVATTR